MTSWEFLQYYTHFDRRWYETATRHVPGDEHLALFRGAVPDGWRTRRRGLWFMAQPPAVTAPAQGWKLHVTALAEESGEVLGLALPVLCGAQVPFKFLIDPFSVRLVNGKVFSRTASGKFITVYPVDEEQFHAVGSALAAALAGRTGPYVLSDRRWPGSTAVYYRYGGFATVKRVRPDGISDLLIEAPDGEPVVDVRHPYFDAPPWATDPFPPEEEDGGELLNGRYRAHTALAFGNRGGVYLATDTKTGQEVVLKEARPGITVGSPGRPVVEVLEKEYRILGELADTGLFVRPIEFFREWDHAFMAQEQVPGRHFSHHCIENNPVITLELGTESLRAYYLGLRGLWRQIARAVAAAHERGIVLGDLSYTNVLVSPEDGTAKVIDLETAVREGVDPQLGVHTVGLASPRQVETRRSDRAADWHALGALVFSSVMVVNNTTGFHRPALHRFLDALAEDLALPAELVELVRDLTDDRVEADGAEVVRRIDALPFDSPAQWAAPVPLSLPATERYADPDRRPGLGDAELAELVEQVVGYAEAVADPQREDRLFPADPMVFETNPLSLAHGALGVLYGIQRIRGTVLPRQLGWALARDVNPQDYPPGLYLGQAGIAWALDELGRPEVAASVLDRTRSHPLRFARPGVLHGSSGYGLACLRLWQRQGLDRFLDDARAVGESLAASCVRDGLGARWPEPAGDGDGLVTRVGYGHGGSGVALFLLYLHLATGEQRWYELGRAALGFDLGQGVLLDGRFRVFPRFATDPATDRASAPATDHTSDPAGATEEPAYVDGVLRNYWDEGTAGVTTTALRYLKVRPDAELSAQLPELLADSCRKYSVFPQLFHGLAGIGNALLDAGELLGEQRWFAEARRVAEGVLLSRIERPEGICFPGDQALRESTDLATGSIGVALFLDRLRKARPGGRTNFNFVLDELLP